MKERTTEFRETFQQLCIKAPNEDHTEGISAITANLATWQANVCNLLNPTVLH